MENNLPFFSLLTQFRYVRAPHNRQVEDGRPLPFESFWAHHLIDFYSFSIEHTVRLLSGFGQDSFSEVGWSIIDLSLTCLPGSCCPWVGCEHR